MKKLAKIVICTALIAATRPTPAIQTGKVELGNNGVYDGTVWIVRNTSGSLVFCDRSVGSSVTLLQLLGGQADHGTLSGLADDDHSQYFNGARHWQTHTAAYNDELPIPPDVGNNSTLGGHMGDGSIHILKNVVETITGAWRFTGIPVFAPSLRIEPVAPNFNGTIDFGTGYSAPRFSYLGSLNEFEFTRPIRATSGSLTDLVGSRFRVWTNLDGRGLSGQPSATVTNFVSLNGIAAGNLLDRTVNEDISGQWDFLSPVRIFDDISFEDATASGVITAAQIEGKDGNVNVKLGDQQGVNKLCVRDSSGATVATIDSKGNTSVASVTATSFTIGGATLASQEWGYLDGQNQAVKTNSTPQFAGVTTPYIKPTVNSATAVQVRTAEGTAVLDVDTTNSRVGIGTTAPVIPLDVRKTGSIYPQVGVAQATDYLTFFASDTYGPALIWNPSKALRFGQGGSGLYNVGGYMEAMRIQGLSIVLAANVKLTAPDGTSKAPFIYSFNAASNYYSDVRETLAPTTRTLTALEYEGVGYSYVAFPIPNDVMGANVVLDRITIYCSQQSGNREISQIALMDDSNTAVRTYSNITADTQWLSSDYTMSDNVSYVIRMQFGGSGGHIHVTRFKVEYHLE